MKRTILSSLILTGMFIFGANAADFGGNFYVENAVISPGETAVLSIQWDNDVDVSGFQFQMLLPTGISYQSWSISKNRLPVGVGADELLSIQSFSNSRLMLAGVLNSGTAATFTKAQGEIATVTIVASPDIPLGTYFVELRGIDICDSMGNDYDVPSTTFTLTVGEPSSIEALNNEKSNAQIFDLLGRRQKEVSEGQAGIVNGRPVYRK